MSSSSDTYNASVQDIKAVEKSIQNDLKELKSQIDTTNNTYNVENSIRKALDRYLSMYTKLNEEYTKKSGKTSGYLSMLPDKEYNRRVNEIQEIKITIDRLKTNYEGLLDSKYKFVC
jgi:hypothetical protein